MQKLDAYTSGNVAETYLAQAFVLATLSHAVRRKTGALVVEIRNDVPYIIGSGCNGQPVGEDNRCESPCLTVTLDSVIHAEVNALRDLPALKKGTRILYCTDSPCAGCAKHINDRKHGIDAVVYAREYRIVDHLCESGVPCTRFDDEKALHSRLSYAQDNYGLVIIDPQHKGNSND